MMRRVFVAALVAMIVGCSKSTPTGPSPGQVPPTPVWQRLLMSAPDSVAPGSVTPLKLVAVRSDNTQEDVSGQAVWTSSNPDILRVAGGVATAVQNGEAGVTAWFGGLTVSKVVMVLEPGTWRVDGLVADSGFGLAGARVEVVSGIGAGKATTTDGNGNYRLYGVAGDVQMRASLDGYESDMKATTIRGNQTHVSFALTPLIKPADLSGDWQLTFEASRACDTLPEIARRRTYTAIIEQKVSALLVRLSGAEFAPDPAGFLGGLMNQFRGRISGDSVTMKLEAYEYYGMHYDIGEILPDRSLLTMTGILTGKATASTISGSFDGTIAILGASRIVIAGCDRPGHQFTFARRSTTARR